MLKKVFPTALGLGAILAASVATAAPVQNDFYGYSRNIEPHGSIIVPSLPWPAFGHCFAEYSNAPNAGTDIIPLTFKVNQNWGAFSDYGIISRLADEGDFDVDTLCSTKGVTCLHEKETMEMNVKKFAKFDVFAMGDSELQINNHSAFTVKLTCSNS